MSPLLYALGSAAFRRRRLVVVLWLVALVAAATGFLTIAHGTSNEFDIPGTESQQALTTLGQVFPQVSGANGEVLAVAAPGHRIDDAASQARIGALATRIAKLPDVANVGTPWNTKIPVRGGFTPQISLDGSAALMAVTMSIPTDKVTPAIAATITDAAKADSDQAITFHVGGSMFQPSTPGVEPTEIIGILVALGVMAVTFGSLLAAGVPLIAALFGVGVGLGLIMTATRWVTISTTAPLLAVMIGLAVGIDYSLFIVSRHRQQLADGLDPEESAGRAVATAGSAVLFAGVTVMIALMGLFVARIPFLTVMGLCAAAGVAVAVLVALTLLPALFGFLGSRLRPRTRSPEAAPKPGRVATRWLSVVTKVPLLTIVLVVALLAGLSTLAIGLRLSLPDNSTAPLGTGPRVTNDLINKDFGPGYNAPLLVTANILSSNDPLPLIANVADDLRHVKGVSAVVLATPNSDADTMIVEVIPDGGANSQATSDLVNRIRGLKPELRHRYGVSIAVTGQAALEIDVSHRLSDSLLPFVLLVVGMSLILLATVFRSIAVPVKATLGYLLSLGSALGVTTEIYQRGFLRGPLHTASVGPIISFAPILLMGVLFGLAMDYEVFLVSRTREDYVHNGDARNALVSGFRGSSKVVVAAALIMCVVFLGFVPDGDADLQPIAMSLAVGVFIDAFLVRMTLGPAVMALLGDKAWWMPRWLDNALPKLDVEGEGVTRQIDLAVWPNPDSLDGIYAECLSLVSDEEPLFDDINVDVDPGRVVVVNGGSGLERAALLLTVAGRLHPSGGKLKAGGFVLPEQAPRVRAVTALIRPAEEQGDLCSVILHELSDRTRVIIVDGLEMVASVSERQRTLEYVARICAERSLSALISISDEAAFQLQYPTNVNFYTMRDRVVFDQGVLG